MGGGAVKGQELLGTDSMVQPAGGMLVQLIPVPGAAEKLSQIGVVITGMRTSFRQSDLTRAEDDARPRQNGSVGTYLLT
jgi:hypothetical protein